MENNTSGRSQVAPASDAARGSILRAARWTLLVVPALAFLLSGCFISTDSPPPLEVVYRVTKADLAFVNSVEYRNANGQITTVSPSSFPWVAVRYFEFGEPVSLAADASASPTNTVTLEIEVTRRSTGTQLATYDAVCDEDPCGPDFEIVQTLASSAVAAAAEDTP